MRHCVAISLNSLCSTFCLGKLGKVKMLCNGPSVLSVQHLRVQVDWSGWAEQDRTPMQKGAISADKSAEVDEAAKKAEGARNPSSCRSSAAGDVRTTRCFVLGNQGAICHVLLPRCSLESKYPGMSGKQNWDRAEYP